MSNPPYGPGGGSAATAADEAAPFAEFHADFVAGDTDRNPGSSVQPPLDLPEDAGADVLVQVTGPDNRPVRTWPPPGAGRESSRVPVLGGPADGARNRSGIAVGGDTSAPRPVMLSGGQGAGPPASAGPGAPPERVNRMALGDGDQRGSAVDGAPPRATGRQPLLPAASDSFEAGLLPRPDRLTAPASDTAGRQAGHAAGQGANHAGHAESDVPANHPGLSSGAIIEPVPPDARLTDDGTSGSGEMARQPELTQRPARGAAALGTAGPGSSASPQTGNRQAPGHPGGSSGDAGELIGAAPASARPAAAPTGPAMPGSRASQSAADRMGPSPAGNGSGSQVGSKSSSSQGPSPAPPLESGGPAPAKPLAGGRDPMIKVRLGNWTITRVLGRGGMGVVYVGEDSERKEVAVKFLSKERSGDARSIKRFLGEAKAAQLINHPAVVGVYDVGQWNDQVYMVMELVRGANAEDFLERRGVLQWREACKVVIEVCKGLAEAHRVGVIHRDIKPANILFARDGSVKLTDFGLAKIESDEGGPKLTREQKILGTAYYISPEQARCKPLDSRTDIYALGATFFQLLTGRPPYDKANSLDVMVAHLTEPVPDPRDVKADLPDAVCEIVIKAMQKDPAARWQHASDMQAALEELLSDRQDSRSGNPDALGDLADFVQNESSMIIRGKAIAAGADVSRPDLPRIVPGQDPRRIGDSTRIDGRGDNQRKPGRSSKGEGSSTRLSVVRPSSGNDEQRSGRHSVRLTAGAAAAARAKGAADGESGRPTFVVKKPGLSKGVIIVAGIATFLLIVGLTLMFRSLSGGKPPLKSGKDAKDSKTDKSGAPGGRRDDGEAPSPKDDSDLQPGGGGPKTEPADPRGGSSDAGTPGNGASGTTASGNTGAGAPATGGDPTAAKWAAYAAEVRRLPGLVAFHDFSEGGGTTLTNLAGNTSFNGWAGGAKWENGRATGRKAMRFAGAGDWVKLPALGRADGFSLLFWVNAKSDPAKHVSLFHTDDFAGSNNTGQNNGIHVHLAKGCVLSIGVGGVQPFQDYTSAPSKIATGKWTHLAIVCRRGDRTLSFFIDGRRVALHTLRQIPEVEIGPGQIGNYVVEDRHFDGLIGEFVFCRQAITDDDVRRIYDLGK